MSVYIIAEEITEQRPRNTAKRLEEIQANLAAIPDAYTLLALYTPKGRNFDPMARRANSGTSSRAPAYADVIDLADRRHKRDADAVRIVPGRNSNEYERDKLAGFRRLGVIPTLLQWVRLVDCDMTDQGNDHPHPPDLNGARPSLVEVCDWLTGQTDWILEQEWARQFEDDVALMLADIRRAGRVKPEEPARLACVDCGWRVEEIKVVHKDKGPGSYFQCTGCPARFSWAELHSRAERMRPKPLSKIAPILGVSVKTLRKYKQDGEIIPEGREGNAETFIVDKVAAVIRKQGRDLTGKYRGHV